MLDRVTDRIRHIRGRDPAVALYVDGPNVLREDTDVDLNDARDLARRRGHLRVCRAYLDHRASANLIQAVEASGFSVRTTSGDVDVALAVDLTSAIERLPLEVIVLATRDLDFKPALELANERGLHTVVVLPTEHGRSDGLTRCADETVSLTA